MPGGDGTGPTGRGPMTGRGAGFCAGYGIPGYESARWGAGHRGGGRGWRHWYYATGLPRWARWGRGVLRPPWLEGADDVSPVDPGGDPARLRAQASYLEDALESVKEKLKRLENSNDVDAG